MRSIRVALAEALYYVVVMTLALAVDLGGTKIEAAIVDGQGRILPRCRTRVATGPHSDHASLTDALASLVAPFRTLAEWDDVTAAGIGAAGPVDLGRGTVSPINLPQAQGFSVVEAVQVIAGLAHVTLRLDGTCIALAESWLGAAQGIDNALIMVVSTGIGGGVISDGRLVRGATGNAGHIGQLVIRDHTGTVEAGTVEGIASGPRTVKWAQSQGWLGDDGESLASAARGGDPIALQAITRSATAVGIGLANAANLLDLELAVVGGGFASVSDDYAEQVQDAVEAHAVNEYARRLKVVTAGLGGDAPLVGAAALVHRPDTL